MSCLICYETYDVLAYLICGHSLCDNCLLKLEQKICPFCRTMFEEKASPKESGNIVIPLPRQTLE